MTDYLPPTGFKHKPSPALDYALLPQREAKAAFESSTDEKEKPKTTEVDDEDTNDHRTSIGPFGECVPVSSIDGSDVYRVQFYADNHALKMPMVSPLFDRRHLRGLPRLLVVMYNTQKSKLHPTLTISFVIAMWLCREVAR
jgi:hypothetical protein